MAGRKYSQKAVTTSIKFTSRCSIQIDGRFYTVESCEERTIPDIAGVDIEKERELLWDTVNDEVDNQMTEIWETYGLKKESVKRK